MDHNSVREILNRLRAVWYDHTKDQLSAIANSKPDMLALISSSNNPTLFCDFIIKELQSTLDKQSLITLWSEKEVFVDEFAEKERDIVLHDYIVNNTLKTFDNYNDLLDHLEKKFDKKYIDENKQIYSSLRHLSDYHASNLRYEDMHHFIFSEKLKLQQANGLETIKTSLKADQIALLANLFHIHFAGQNDKAKIQRVIASTLIPDGKDSPITLQSLNNKMKPSHNPNQQAKAELRDLLYKWYESLS